ncbi:NlpC/P60 family protein [Kushneria sinocarnis]|uniref:NlpC/P60 family protein n=1 Tax=Kushneria sinocarnis TaxID=595502 RepID=A0A420WWA5_9GAMM|nr:C40 family peptidase [Kushneria sinocarnis]RKR03406.1 NlpC/P60 family protein [Kushneria sinocarnis]
MSTPFPATAWRRFHGLLTVLTLLLLAGCAGNPPLDVGDTGTADQELSIDRVLIIERARQALGTPYRYGGTTASGMDCSGLAQVSYAAAGITIPRTSQQQFDRLPHRDVARPGDLLFFGSGSVSHVGVYIGNQQMIHAPGSGRSVRTSNITKRYWRQHYRGAAGPAR